MENITDREHAGYINPLEDKLSAHSLDPRLSVGNYNNMEEAFKLTPTQEITDLNIYVIPCKSIP